MFAGIDEQWKNSGPSVRRDPKNSPVKLEFKIGMERIYEKVARLNDLLPNLWRSDITVHKLHELNLGEVLKVVEHKEIDMLRWQE